MEPVNKVYLHVGCANQIYEGFINSDKSTISSRGGKYEHLDEVFDLSEKWPHEDESVDGIVGMAVFEQLHWRELVSAFREAYRVLKPGCVIRIGVPLLENGMPLDHILGWNNINLLTYDSVSGVLDRIGFSSCRLQNYHQSANPDLTKPDNRIDHMFYIEAIK